MFLSEIMKTSSSCLFFTFNDSEKTNALSDFLKYKMTIF